jgi:hypothetical protein
MWHNDKLKVLMSLQWFSFWKGHFDCVLSAVQGPIFNLAPRGEI